MLAPTPPMGWNSWNTFGGKLDAKLVMETADAFVAEGLKDAGYEYVVMDDIWEADERLEGKLVPDASKFPDGIKPVADYVHSKGLKFGIYSCAGSYTCAGKPASYGYEEVDAQTFADWGVDFLKYDFCYAPPGTDGPTLYRRMGQALRATGRPIIFSLCEWGQHEPWTWAASVGGHMWRTTGDINDSWDSIVKIGFDKQAGLHSHAGPDRWNDPDMLVVGMYGEGNVAHGGCNDAEYRSHFGLWCLLASPLMLGCDVRSMNQATKDIVMNKELIAVNQDPMGCQGYRVGKAFHGRNRGDIWAKPLEDGSIAVGLFNLSDMDARRMTVAWESIGLHDRRTCTVRDLTAGVDLGEATGQFSTRVGTHDVAVVKLTPQ